MRKWMATLMLAFAVVGCGEAADNEEPECEKTEECGDREWCSEKGDCVPSDCENSRDCPPNYRCATEINVCVYNDS